MIRHIVLWRMKSADQFDTPFATRFTRNSGASQVESQEALAAYHKHPVHMATRALVDPLVEEHWIADYQTPASMRAAKT